MSSMSSKPILCAVHYIFTLTRDAHYSDQTTLLCDMIDFKMSDEEDSETSDEDDDANFPMV